MAFTTVGATTQNVNKIFRYIFCRGAVRNACMMLMAVSLDNRDVYEEEFEKACLRQSAEFYRVSEQQAQLLRFFSC